MKMKERIPICISVLGLPLAELGLHTGQLLLLLFDFLSEVSILVLQKIKFGQQLRHLDVVLLFTIFQGSLCNSLPLQ